MAKCLSRFKKVLVFHFSHLNNILKIREKKLYKTFLSVVRFMNVERWLLDMTQDSKLLSTEMDFSEISLFISSKPCENN